MKTTEHYFLSALIAGLLVLPYPTMANETAERADIYQVLKEIDYIEEVITQLKKKYQNNRGKVRFNYDAMLAQLRAIQSGTIEYLNNDIQTLHATPPKTVERVLYRVRKN